MKASKSQETFVIQSKYVNDDFEIRVVLPTGYEETQKLYPVVYILDSNIFFDMVKGITHLLQYGKEIPEVILIGIGYPDDSRHMTLRGRDYLPTHHRESALSGGADRFYDFLTKELKPHVEEAYRASVEDAVLVGDSYSGLFALYALFQSPGVFSGYVIGSPSIYWDGCAIYRFEENYAQRHSEMRAKVFMAVGALEAVYEPAFARMVGNVEEMYEKLLDRDYHGLKIHKKIFEGETHLSVIPSIMSRGLRVILGSEL